MSYFKVMCRLCSEHLETVEHLISGRTYLASLQYKHRHNEVAKYFHWFLFSKYWSVMQSGGCSRKWKCKIAMGVQYLQPDLWKPVLSPINADLIFLHKHKALWTHYQISQSSLSGLAFPKPISNPMSGTGPWWRLGRPRVGCVAVQLCSVE